MDCSLLIIKEESSYGLVDEGSLSVFVTRCSSINWGVIGRTRAIFFSEPIVPDVSSLTTFPSPGVCDVLENLSIIPATIGPTVALRVARGEFKGELVLEPLSLEERSFLLEINSVDGAFEFIIVPFFCFCCEG